MLLRKYLQELRTRHGNDTALKICAVSVPHDLKTTSIFSRNVSQEEQSEQTFGSLMNRVEHQSNKEE
jgi:hypothetical protein